MTTTSQHNLGEFIVRFQGIERGINGLIIMLAQSDESVVKILINEHEFGKRIKTLDVLYLYFLSVQTKMKEQEAREKHAVFHSFIVKIQKLSERRNALVHSEYTYWEDVAGSSGLLRTNFKLSGGKGERLEQEEELQPHDFKVYFKKMNEISELLEMHRMQIIDWLYPDAK